MDTRYTGSNPVLTTNNINNMELTKNQKISIEEKYDSMDPRNIEFEDIVGLIIDDLLDENIVDISGDDNGDLHEDLYNTVWEHLEFYIG